jgi:hypothetical protein
LADEVLALLTSANPTTDKNITAIERNEKRLGDMSPP